MKSVYFYFSCFNYKESVGKYIFLLKKWNPLWLLFIKPFLKNIYNKFKIIINIYNQISHIKEKLKGINDLLYIAIKKWCVCPRENNQIS